MKLKIRHANDDGIARIELDVNIKELLINEGIVHPGKESVSLCFKGKSSSGIVDLSIDELDALFNKVGTRIHLIKGLRKVSNWGARFI